MLFTFLIFIFFTLVNLQNCLSVKMEIDSEHLKNGSFIDMDNSKNLQNKYASKEIDDKSIQDKNLKLAS